MKMKKVLGLSACTIAIIMIAGCGKSENNTGRTMVNNQNNVQNVLEQGIAEAGSTDESASDIPEQNEPVTDAAKETQSLIQEEAPLPVPVIEPVNDTSTGDGEDYVDLTALSSTMVYSEVYNMMYYPENYVGKTVKMSGVYAVYHDESTDKYYHACIISDATACCSQGIEFELTENYTYPDDYPEEGGQICVTGTFDTYQEGEYTYCTLRDAEIQG